MAIGRISGPLLKNNLIRDGIDLAFETDLLYLDVNNSRIGINTAAPQYALDVVGTTRSSNLDISADLTVGNFLVSGNTISSNLPTISFIASGGEATAYHSRLIVNDIELNGNVISTTSSNADLELNPNGTGKVNIQAPAEINGTLNVTGDINATGNITIGGNLTIGDSLSDTITINASIRSDLVPETTGVWDLGSPSYKWGTVYASTVNADTLSIADFNVGNLHLYDNTITTTTGNLILDANGTGHVRIGNLTIRDNQITNVVADSVTEITQSGTGYFKIAGTNGFIPPRGSTSDRPLVINSVEGMTRYNTDSKALEIWDGSLWASPAGTIGAVSESTANEIAIKYALTLG